MFDYPAHPEAGTHLPGGGTEPGERPDAAAIREAIEETGVTGHLRLCGVVGVQQGTYNTGNPYISIYFHLALDRVECDPQAEGDFYPGDLLNASMRRVPDSYWRAHEDQRARVRAVVEALDPDETLDLLYVHAAEFLGR